VEVGEGQRDAVVEDRGKSGVQYADAVGAIGLVKQHTDGAVGVSGDDVELAIAIDVDQVNSLLLRCRTSRVIRGFLEFSRPQAFQHGNGVVLTTSEGGVLKRGNDIGFAVAIHIAGGKPRDGVVRASTGDDQ